MRGCTGSMLETCQASIRGYILPAEDHNQRQRMISLHHDACSFPCHDLFLHVPIDWGQSQTTNQLLMTVQTVCRRLMASGN